MAISDSIPSVFVANRGEIARRVIRTLKRLGIRSLAAYHEVDADAPFVQAADGACLLTGSTPTAAYLDIEQLVALAASRDAAAIHPGYGFLAENADFATAVIDGGMGFVGPTPDVIRLMGDKVASREFVAEHGFPLAPSIASNSDDPAALLNAAREIGFPVLIKAAAGGGGKGMHIVSAENQFADAYALAQSEALRYFADARVYCEKYLERPRHIEVQIFADNFGHCIHLGERECSVQRRFQKLIEETPSPGISKAVRSAICDTAVAIAKAANYTNAGTVEFIVGENSEFYFLEMNTRLQVEHPVTEMTTGLDLVELQLQVAAGEPLPLDQAAVQQTGHAIECRICAEDADQDFLPATGQIVHLHEPTGHGVRIDSGLAPGMRVTTAFDPMLSKLIVHADDRRSAAELARKALKEQVVLGVTTNAAFLSRVLAHPAFQRGATHTHFIDDHRDDLTRRELSESERDALVAIAALHDDNFRRLIYDAPQPHAQMGAWRNA